MRVSAELKKRVEDHITAKMALAVEKLGEHAKIKRPRVVYKKRGTTAGAADYRQWEIDLNSVLLVENDQLFIDRTVTHELAHLIDYKLHPENFEVRRGQKRDIHGFTWKRIMRVLGVDPSRCHTYDTTNAKVKKSAGYKYRYTCDTCGGHMDLGSQRHAKMKSGMARYWMRSCKHHAGYTFTHVIHPNGSAIEQHGIRLPKVADASVDLTTRKKPVNPKLKIQTPGLQMLKFHGTFESLVQFRSIIIGYGAQCDGIYSTDNIRHKFNALMTADVRQRIQDELWYKKDRDFTGVRMPWNYRIGFEEVGTEMSKAAASPKHPTKRPRNSQGSGSSKKDQARVIVQDMFDKGHGRQMTIQRLMDVLGMTKAGASTYFYNAKKELGL